MFYKFKSIISLLFVTSSWNMFIFLILIYDIYFNNSEISNFDICFISNIDTLGLFLGLILKRAFRIFTYGINQLFHPHHTRKTFGWISDLYTKPQIFYPLRYPIIFSKCTFVFTLLNIVITLTNNPIVVCIHLKYNSMCFYHS